MDYPQVLDTFSAYWPHGPAAAGHELCISLSEAYRGTQRTVERDGAPLSLTIPPGVHTGSRVYLPRTGHEHSRVVDYCTIRVMDQPPFKRSGDDLHLELPVEVHTLIHGGEVDVPTLAGPDHLRIAPWTAPGRTLRLRGRGMPLLNQPNVHGDLCVHLQVIIPAEATPLERKLIGDVAWLCGWRFERH